MYLYNAEKMLSDAEVSTLVVVKHKCAMKVSPQSKCGISVMLSTDYGDGVKGKFARCIKHGYVFFHLVEPF